MNAGRLTEDELVEQPALRLLAQLGWEVASGFDEPLGSAGTLGRDSQSEPVLGHRLRDSLRTLNPGLPDPALDEAAERLVEDRSAMDRVRANREVHALLREGARVETVGSDRKRRAVTVRFVDWNRADANDWLAVSQFWIAGDMYKRRADVVLFVNGIPLVFIELKVSHKNVRDAYDGNLRDYRDTVPHLFWFNSFVVLSNGADTLIGSTFAPWDHFAEWKKINSEGEQGVVSLETALRGTCERHRLLDLVENFVAFTERPGGLVKAFAKNHQFLGVNNSLEALRELQQRESRLGVFWHTQGSGKSLSMLWFTQKVLRKQPGNWTFVLVTDRKELDEQLYGDFADSGVITSGREVHAEKSAHLRELLGEDHRYVFTLIHKFIPPEKGQRMPVLSERDDIVVITDEAHRSPVRHAGRQHAPGAAQRLVPRVHRHTAHRRRGGDPAGLRRLRFDLQLPGLHRRRLHRPALLREPHPGAAAHQRRLRRRAGRPPRRGCARRRPREGGGAPLLQAVRANHPAPAPGRDRRGSGPPLRQPGIQGQGHVRGHRQGHHGAHVRPG